jgi:hypothetical protein
MTPLSDVVDGIIAPIISECCKPFGYTRKRRDFYRSTNDCICITNIQTSSSSTASAGKITLNLGIYFPNIASLVGGREGLSTPKESDCTLRSRIGSLMPLVPDKWWEVTAENSEVVASDICSVWVAFGEPWLTQNSDPATARESLIRKCLYREAAALELLHGNRDEAARILSIGVSTTKDPLLREHLRTWAKLQSVKLES